MATFNYKPRKMVSNKGNQSFRNPDPKSTRKTTTPDNPSANEDFSPDGWPKGKSGALKEYQDQRARSKGPSTRRKGRR